MSLTSQGAGGTLSFPSPKSSREFKHKPICERIFCLSVIHFSVGLSSQTSGVLLAFKLACVSISLTDRLSIVKGVWCSFFVVHVSFQDLMYSHGAGGRGKRETIAIFTDALETTVTTTSAPWHYKPLAVGPRTHLRGETVAFLSEIRTDLLSPLGCLSSFSRTLWKGFAS